MQDLRFSSTAYSLIVIRLKIRSVNLIDRKYIQKAYSKFVY